MNKKIALTFLSFLVANNSMAMEIVNGKLINHKEWASNNATGSFLENNNPNKLPKQLRTSPEDNRAYLDAFNIIFPPAKIQAGKIISTDSNSRIHISNDTPKSHKYFIECTICNYAEGNSAPIGCAYAQDDILLDPQGSVIINRSPTIEMTLAKGYYYTTLTTTIISDDASYNSSTMIEFNM